MFPFKHNRLILSAIAVLIGSVNTVFGQGEPAELPRSREPDKSALGSIRGRLLLPGGGYVNANVKVTLQTMRDVIVTIYTDSQGQFEFSELIPGSYQIEVDPTDRENFDVSSEAVQVFRGAPSVVAFTLKARAKSVVKPASRTVSLSELTRDVPSKAKKEFEKASNAAERGLAEEAISHLRKAIEIHPGFAIAYNDLGVQLLSLGRLNEAREALQRALELDSNSFNSALNLGIVYVHLHQFPHANEVLKKALALAPNSAAARLYAGLAHKGLGNSQLAERELKIAHDLGGVKYALALFYLGQLHLGHGNRSLALQYFEQYLTDVPDAVNADQVRQLIAVLR